MLSLPLPPLPLYLAQAADAAEPAAKALGAHFTWIDWTVLVGYLLLTTLIGHFMSGKQATIKDFFAAGRSLPWPAVCGSIIATELSALTFIGVPGTVYALNGDFTYMQWGIGSILARFVVGYYFVPVFYHEDIYSPYDYVGRVLGEPVKRIITCLFFLGSILGQSVRVLVPALILRTLLDLPIELCIAIITGFAIVWTLMGGMRTVIWTDVIQFFIFTAAGLLGLVWLCVLIDGGFAGMLAQAGEAGKLRLWNLSTDPMVQFTLWVGLFSMPFQNMAAFGTDQLNAQRMFCCRNAGDARKAIIWSSASQLITWLMLTVGAALWVYYQQNAPSPEAAALFREGNDYVFPVWILTVLPQGLTGLILAGAFAAAISSLDSLLAALSQTTLSMWQGFKKRVLHVEHETEAARDAADAAHQLKTVKQSRFIVLGWGLALGAFTLVINAIKGNVDLIPLAFGMVAYTQGPMLGIFLMALWQWRVPPLSVAAAAITSVLLVAFVQPHLWTFLEKFIGLDLAYWDLVLRPRISFAWFYPITTFLTLGMGWLLRTRSPVQPLQ